MSPNKLRLSLDLRFVTLLLAFVILGMLLVWKPWVSDPGNNARTVEVTGEATVKAAPDTYTFSPTYEFKNTDKAVALADATKKNDEVVAKLKELGVTDNKIKSSVDNYYYSMYSETSTDETTYSVRLTIEVGDRKLAQKVQDYLVTTSPLGTITPSPTFSEAKRKQLESSARDTATKDARSKADQSAKNLGFKVGKVKSVTDGVGFNPVPYMSSKGRNIMSANADTSAPSLELQPGENDLSYSVSVVYYLR